MTLSGGGFQYIQDGADCGGVGWWEFGTVAVEDAATPMLDIRVNPKHQTMPNGKTLPCIWPGFQSVTIIGSGNFDAQFAGNCWVDPVKKDLLLPNCSRPVVALNCSGCSIDGLLIIGATGSTKDAVVLHNTNPANPADGDIGTVKSALVLDGHAGGSYDLVDDAGNSVGNWASKNLGGGWTIVQDAYPIEGRPAGLSGDSTHALLLGNSGERTGRLAIDGDGALRWGNGGENDTFDTTLLKPVHKKLAWDPPPLPAGAATNLTVPMGDKPHCRGTGPARRGPCTPLQHHLLFYGQPEPGDPVSVGFSAAGEADVQLTAQVSASYPADAARLSEVRVVLRNVGARPVDLGNGTLRLVVTKWE
eukprot:SAG22_NODE_1001_length_6086_cov_3.870887_6_plen_361_part_00